MAKKKVTCPDCGHQFTEYIGGAISTVAGVHSRRLTDNQFEYTAIMPGHLSFGGGEQGIKKFYTIPEQALLVGLVGLSAGSLLGFLASQPFPIEYCLQIIPGCALSGMTVALALLAAERNCILTRALPWFVKQRAGVSGKLASASVDLNVTLRNRDGNTESGRTINRFGELPVDIDQFNEWAQGALLGKKLGISHWTPKAKMFAKDNYLLLLAKMKAGHIVADLGSNKGHTLTAGGRRALSRHLQDCGITPPSPASEEDFFGERLAQSQANNGGNTPLPHSGVRAGG